MSRYTCFLKYAAIPALLLHVACLNYQVDVSNRTPYSNLVGKCFLTKRKMMVYTWNEGAGTGTHIGGGQFGAPVQVHGWLEIGSKIMVTKVMRKHIGYYGDLVEPEVEFVLNGSTMRAGAFQLFLTSNSAFGPNPDWVSPCQ